MKESDYTKNVVKVRMSKISKLDIDPSDITDHFKLTNLQVSIVVLTEKL